MLKFHEKISPVKNQEAGSGLPFYNGSNKLMSSCTEIAFGFLKICICVLGPAAFPAIIFCIEGNSYLFWQATAASCAIILILAFMSLTILYANVNKFTQQIGDTFRFMSNLFNQFKIHLLARAAIIPDILKNNIHGVSYLLFLSFICNSVTYLSYSKNYTAVFYCSLMTTGFVYGILMSLFYNLLNTPDIIRELPIHNTSKVRLHVTAPSPELQRAKRNLNLDHSKARERNHHAFRFSQPNRVFLPERSKGTLQLPFDFGKLFRRLSF